MFKPCIYLKCLDFPDQIAEISLTYTEKLIFIRFGKWQITYYIYNENLSTKITNIQQVSTLMFLLLLKGSNFYLK